MAFNISFFFIFISITIKVIAIHLTNFDLFGDEAQYWLWAQSPEFGYYSKPPMLAWILNLHTIFVGHSFESLKYFPLFFYFFTSIIIYFLSYELYENKKLAIISAISFYLLPAVSVSSFLISTDVVLIFFCTFFLLVLLRTRKKPSLTNLLILGIFFGISFLTKYAIVYYFISLVLLIFLDKKLRLVFASDFTKPFVFFVSLLVVLFPNIWWNFNNSWVTVAHTSDNAGLNRFGFKLFQGLEFFLTQIGMLGPILFFSFLFFIKKIKFNFQTKFLLAFSMPVFIIIFFESILVRANANWAAVGLIPIYLLMISHVYFYSKKIIIYNNIANLIFCLILFGLISLSSDLKIFDRIRGISDFSISLEKDYLENYDFLVVEDRLLFSSMSYYLKKSDKKIFTPHNPKNKIKSHFHISNPLKQEQDEDFVFIGNPNSLNYLKTNFLVKKKSTIKVNFFSRPIEIYEVFF